MTRFRSCGLIAGLALAAACQGTPVRDAARSGVDAPFAGVKRADELIQRGERHFARLWQVTHGGENARARWSPDGRRLAFQSMDLAQGRECDQIWILDLDDGQRRQLSDRGANSLGGFVPDGSAVIVASTRAREAGCAAPRRTTESEGWRVRPAAELYALDITDTSWTTWVESEGFDGEAAVAADGKVVFASTRSGGVELWALAEAGAEPTRLTERDGYDGEPRFSPDGTRLVFRKVSEDRRGTEIALSRADGSNVRALTSLGRANASPVFDAQGEFVLFASNHHDPAPGLNYDLFRMREGEGEPERLTTFDRGLGRQYDGDPAPSPDGRYLAFSSNRGASEIGETNVFIAEWK